MGTSWASAGPTVAVLNAASPRARPMNGKNWRGARTTSESVTPSGGCHNPLGAMGQEERLSRADLHIHTTVSDGMATVAEILAFAEDETALDVIGIADHDQVRGALDAVERRASRTGGRVAVVVGTEIS